MLCYVLRGSLEETPLNLVSCGCCCHFRRRCQCPAQALRDGPDARERDEARKSQGQPKKYISAQRYMMDLKGGLFCF